MYTHRRNSAALEKPLFPREGRNKNILSGCIQTVQVRALIVMISIAFYTSFWTPGRTHEPAVDHRMLFFSTPIIIIKHVLVECADLVEVRKKYSEEKSLYLLFRNVNPENIFYFLREIGVL